MIKVDVWVNYPACLCFSRIIQANGGSPPLTYKKFLHVLSVLGEPEKPCRDVSAEDFL